jgi:TolB-like protein
MAGDRGTTDRRAGSGTIRFPPFEADLRTHELWKGGSRLRLQSKPFQVLAVLLERPGALVTRDELQRRLWPDEAYGDFDHGINVAVNKIRDSLGDTRRKPRYIETLPGLGYRFVASVERTEPIGPAPIRSIAVLPLENLSGDPSQEFIADGITEELITAVSRVQALRVISRTSAMRYKGLHRPVSDIARDLTVDAIVEGTIRGSGERFRITVRLIQAVDERQVWAENYDCERRDILGLEGRVAQAIATAIAVVLTARERARLVSQRRVDPDAHECYLRGRYFWNKRTVDDLRRANDYFESAIDKDPLYAVAHSGLADTWFYRGYYFGDLAPDVAMPRAKAAALNALDIDEGLAEAHTSLALVHFFYDWDMKNAGREFERALELNPSYVTAHHGYSIYLAAMRRYDDSTAEATRALAVDPLSLPILNIVGEMLLAARRYDEAIEQTRKTLELHPNNALASGRLADAYTALGRTAEAVDERIRVAALAGEPSETLDALRHEFERRGFQGFRERDLELLISRFRGWHWDAYEIARQCARLRRGDEALAWLTKACEARSGAVVWTNIHHDFDWLHSESRFQDLLARRGTLCAFRDSLP